MIDTLRLALQGVALAVANLIPGVSGGTMAVMLGIYERLLESISRLAAKPFGSWSEVAWLARLGAGAILGLVLFARIIGWALEDFPQQTYLLFMGLIVGSLPCVLRFHDLSRIRLVHVLSLAVGFGVVLYFGYRAMEVEAAEVGATAETVAWLPLLLGGALAGGAMIVPGVSGSLMLVLIGTYDDALAAVNDRNFPALAILAAGAAIGIIFFAGVIRWCYQKVPVATHMFIVGLVAASVVAIFRGFPVTWPGTLAGLGLFVAGALVAYVFSAPANGVKS